MSQAVRPLLSTDPSQPGAWPWIIAALGFLATSFVSIGVLQRIPEHLDHEASARLDRFGSDGIDLRVDGRDIELIGRIAPDADRELLVADLESIRGTRLVRDELTVVDPAVEAADRRRAFQAALAELDLSPVAFEPGSSDFVAGSETSLDAVVELLQAEPAFRIRVAGHTDDTGRSAANLELSRDRARRVQTHLVDSGIEPDRIIAQGYGDTQPIADNGTESGRARNRRIEIRYSD